MKKLFLNNLINYMLIIYEIKFKNYGIHQNTTN